MWKIEKVAADGREPVAVVSLGEGGEVIGDVQSALDMMATVRYETDCDRIAIDKTLLDERFFDLKTGLAGEIVQKFVNYHVKFAIVGDFSGYESRSLRDFIYECNQGSDLFFLPTERQAVEKLGATR
ncbi:DUF4180 domain-containing protein [Cohnella sp. JJ-181]|uniref:DUF4180 domain-containing protein n=1 Tax=Cohnella rhizoplanae TaxID=2974897 RepID=UPI0022FF8CCF|nr:DUF4180 domain-containing protein [Cohnella sp. JJ-181]CAI6087073.1 hypothetical protein COHCIP112018_05316 [Cohnella sp. JJ-181]